MDKQKIIIAAIVLFLALDVAAYFYIQSAMERVEQEETQQSEPAK